MADLTKPFDIKGKYNPLDVIAFPMAVETIYRGAAIGYVKGTGYAKGIAYDSNPAERFLGVSLETIVNAGSAGDKSVKVARKGLFLFNGGGSLVAADVGKLVYFSDDNTITTTVGNILAGRLEVVDAEGAWIRIDEATEKNVKLRPIVMQPQTLGAAGTARRVGYVVPTGAVAFLVAGKYGYSAKPNFGTTAVLLLNKVSATTRTTLLSTADIDVNDTTPAVDVPTALTLAAAAATLKMIADDRLEATVDNPFEAAWKAANPAFFSAFGRDGGLSYKPAAESAYTISGIPVDEKPVPRFAPNGTHEFDEWRWKISSESNVLGRVDVKIMGFKGQACDKILSLDGRDWFIVYRDAGNDPGMQIITLRDKGVPWDYDNE